MRLFAKRNKAPLGIYIHIPFCRSKCAYCDFYSLPCQERNNVLMQRYLKALCAHIKECGALAPNYKVDTIYFGGGTPSFFGSAGLSTVLAAIRRSFDVDSQAEITFEANPDSVTDKLLQRLRSEGFNRVSLGIQCDDDKILQTIGRPHTYEEAREAVAKIRKAGFNNLSVDLIYGLPGQTMAGWKQTVENVLDLHPEHISCYGLKVEEGTPLYENQHRYHLPDDDRQADMYLAAVDLLTSKGFRQYEISNFARKGLYSRHNMKYWMGNEYLGFGPSASSDFAGRRFTMVRDIEAYIRGIRTGGEVIEESEEINLWDRAGEYIMLRLRTLNGISGEDYERRFRLPFAPLEEELEKQQGFATAVKSPDGRWRLTPKGYLISNSIISDLLAIQDTTRSIKP
ncbi:MAG: radical SAM family heme chaperone HemW [Oscillospiraceae bacterium]|nr:radical SAM family heme chaperone HemW [Oscillospiraceae bacterium]